MQLSQELMSVGLTDKESDVYIATLQLGYATVQEVALKTEINRTTVYTHIKNLISRGLLSAVERNGKTFFIAEKPEKLKYICEEQEKELLRRKELLENLMPQLESIYNIAKEKPTVKFYNHKNAETLDGLRQEIQEIRADEIFNIFNYERFHEYTNRKHIQNLLNSVSKFRALYISKNKIVDLRIQPLLSDERFHLRYLPLDKFDFLCEVLIAGDHVYIARENDSLLIKDKLFSQTLILLFQAIWGLAEKF